MSTHWLQFQFTVTNLWLLIGWRGNQSSSETQNSSSTNQHSTPWSRRQSVEPKTPRVLSLAECCHLVAVTKLEVYLCVIIVTSLELIICLVNTSTLHHYTNNQQHNVMNGRANDTWVLFSLHYYNLKLHVGFLFSFYSVGFFLLHLIRSPTNDDFNHWLIGLIFYLLIKLSLFYSQLPLDIKYLKGHQSNNLNFQFHQG